MCVKKQRHMDINTDGFRFGFRAFQKFFNLTASSKKTKTHQDFIDSQFYIDFIKFGNHLALLKPIHIEQYIEFVIMNGVKLKDWTNDTVYYLYVQNLVKTEPAVSATERTISEIIKWCDSNNVTFDNFFSKITANEGAHLIKIGKISPWVLYLASSGENLMNEFNEDHAKMIGDIVDPGFWMRKFKKSDDDVSYIKNLLEQAGL